MIEFLLTRTIRSLITIVVVFSIVFFGTRLSGNTIDFMFPDGIDASVRNDLVAYFGLNGSYLEQYWKFWRGVFEGNMGISLYEFRPVTQIYGGQRQRICIARALALNPDLVIADEPVSALDVSIQARVLDLLQEIQEEMGITYLFISHDMAVIEKMSDDIAVMYMGRILEYGARESVLGNPTHPYTQNLLQAVPVPDPRIVFRPPKFYDEGRVSPIVAVDERDLAPIQYIRTSERHFVATEAVMN